MRIDANHEYLDSFGGFRVGDADRGAFQDSRMAGDRLFDLVWIPLNPETMIMSFLRSTILVKPSGDITPISPVRKKPSLVITGRFSQASSSNRPSPAAPCRKSRRFADRDFLAIVITDRNVRLMEEAIRLSRRTR